MNRAHHGYHKKYESVATRRALRIMEHVDNDRCFLDIGCNAGQISMALLNRGCARHVHGIDLDRTIVDQNLMSDSRFSFCEGDIAYLEDVPDADYSVYSAVHHHILYHHGLTAALRSLRRIVAATHRAIFFETGRIAESSYWPWQSAMRRYFRTDEEHHAYLFASLEGAIEDVKLVGKVRIHGISRWMFMILLVPRDRRPPESLAGLSSVSRDNLGRWVRRFGSRQPGLFPMPSRGNSDSPCEYDLGGAYGQTEFVKRHVHRPYYARLENELGSQVNRPWAVRSVAYSPDTAEIRFPLVPDEARIMSEALSDQDRQTARQDVARVFEQARILRVKFGAGSWRFRNIEGNLLDFCDLNPNNVLLIRSGSGVAVRIVDFEPQGRRLGYRNRLNHAAMARMFGGSSLHLAANLAAGYVGFYIEGVMAHFRALPARIAVGVPALGSLLWAEIATYLGRRLKSLVDRVRNLR